jgi:hypothetical protein
MPILAALGTVLLGFLIGGILIAAGHVVIGVAVAFAALPFGLAVWIKVSDRM